MPHACGTVHIYVLFMSYLFVLHQTMKRCKFDYTLVVLSYAIPTRYQ